MNACFDMAQRRHARLSCRMPAFDESQFTAMSVRNHRRCHFACQDSRHASMRACIHLNSFTFVPSICSLHLPSIHAGTWWDLRTLDKRKNASHALSSWLLQVHFPRKQAIATSGNFMSEALQRSLERFSRKHRLSRRPWLQLELSSPPRVLLACHARVADGLLSSSLKVRLGFEMPSLESTYYHYLLIQDHSYWLGLLTTLECIPMAT